MSESRAKRENSRFDSPYARVGILFAGIIIALGLIFVINFIARGMGGNEKKLMEALVATLQEPRINGEFSLAQQAQTNTFDAKGTFSVDKLQKLALNGEVNGLYQNEQLKVPVQAFMDVEKSDTYIRITNGQKLADTISASAPTLKNDLNSISNKINDKWLFIEQGENKSNTCTADLFKKIASDENAAKDVAGVFVGNRFLAVDSLEQKNDTTQEFTVRYDEKAMSGFIKSLKSKEYFKSIKTCDETYDPMGTEAAAAASSQNQAAQQKAAEPEVTTKVTVEDNRITNLVTVSSLNEQVNTTRVSFNFKPGDALKAPEQDIVSSNVLKDEMSSLGQMLQQQQQQQSGLNMPAMQ